MRISSVPRPESGLIVDLSELVHFRFQDLGTYCSLKGQNIKEMDYVFIYEQQLYFLEIKNLKDIFKDPQKQDLSFQEQNKAFALETEKLRKNLQKTLTDALLMMCAVWLETALGRQLKNDGIPPEMWTLQEFRLILGIDFPAGFEQHMTSLNDGLIHSFKGYIRLFGSGNEEIPRKVGLLNYEKLIRKFPFIRRSLPADGVAAPACAQ